jgi:hypothetical protein
MTWDFTPELEASIIEALENGDGLHEWCRGERRPSRSTVLRWQREYPEFDAKCARAREYAGELFAERQKPIIESVLTGQLSPQAANVALSGMQWLASKLKHRSYGNKLQSDIQHLDAAGKPTNPPSSLPTHVAEKLDAILDSEF